MKSRRKHNLTVSCTLFSLIPPNKMDTRLCDKGCLAQQLHYLVTSRAHFDAKVSTSCSSRSFCSLSQQTSGWKAPNCRRWLPCECHNGSCPGTTPRCRDKPRRVLCPSSNDTRVAMPYVPPNAYTSSGGCSYFTAEMQVAAGAVYSEAE